MRLDFPANCEHSLPISNSVAVRAELGNARWRSRITTPLLRLVPAFGRSFDQVLDYAAAWNAANRAALALPAEVPLLVVLGDSTAQGVGAPSWDTGYVGRTVALLTRRDGRPWRVLNLSLSGAVIADVLDDQLPRLAEADVHPQLVSAIVGGNDLRRVAEPVVLSNLHALVEKLPEGALVANLPRGLREQRARVANAQLRREAPGRGLVLADLWAHTGPPWRGKYADGLHPNAAGITGWVTALAEALDLPREENPPRVVPRRRRPSRG